MKIDEALVERIVREVVSEVMKKRKPGTTDNVLADETGEISTGMQGTHLTDVAGELSDDLSNPRFPDMLGIRSADARQTTAQTADVGRDSAIVRQGDSTAINAGRSLEEEIHDVDIQEDITSREVKRRPLLKNPQDPEALERMMRLTTARIGVGCAGPRLMTQTLLTLRADHARARDAVMLDVKQEVLDDLHLFQVQTRCHDKNEFLTRPDLGRRLSEEGAKRVREECVMNPDVQLIVADGLSSTAINANIRNVLPVLADGLAAAGLTVGTPFFVQYGRVAVEDEVAELLGAKVVCIFVGERPGLGTAESMSAYLAYNARIGMPEARRTVVSNIHKDGITAVEAGAYMTELIGKILDRKASGVELQN